MFIKCTRAVERIHTVCQLTIYYFTESLVVIVKEVATNNKTYYALFFYATDPIGYIACKIFARAESRSI